jgi:hypothetical protein
VKPRFDSSKARNSGIHESLKSKILLLFFCTTVLLGWTLVTPVGSSGDDDFHLTSIWCSAGSNMCQQTADYGVNVPAEISKVPCYVGRELSGFCSPSSYSRVYQVTERINEGQYPGGFHFINSYLVTENLTASILSMRLAGVAIFVLLLSLSLLSASVTVSSIQVVLILLFGQPLSFFLIASTNPSSWSVASLLTAGPLLYSATSSKDLNKRRVAWLGYTIAATIAILSRADAALFLSLTSVLFLMFFKARNPLFKLPLTSIFSVAVVALSSLFVALNSAQTSEKITNFTSLDSVTHTISYQNVELDGSIRIIGTDLYLNSNLFSNVLQFPKFVAGSWGETWGLGWKGDVYISPLLTALGFTFLFAVVLLSGLGQSHRLRRARWSIIALGILLPLVFFQIAGYEVGTGLQPRYFLPLWTGLTFLLVGILNSNKSNLLIPKRLSYGLAFFSFSMGVYSWNQLRDRYAFGQNVLEIRNESLNDWASIGMIQDPIQADWKNSDWNGLVSGIDTNNLLLISAMVISQFGFAYFSSRVLLAETSKQKTSIPN